MKAKFIFKKLIFLSGIVICFVKNSPAQTINTIYKAINPTEEAALQKADKSVFPDDVRRDIKKHENKFVVWTGIVDTIIFNQTAFNRMEVDIHLQHRYYDFLENTSVQEEKIFLSPYGEGYYIFTRIITGDHDYDELQNGLRRSFCKECLLFTYGTVSTVKDSLPQLAGENIRIVFPGNYATNILSYKIQRDAKKNVVMVNGLPKLTEITQLRVPAPGRNQIGSKLQNSKD